MQCGIKMMKYLKILIIFLIPKKALGYHIYEKVKRYDEIENSIYRKN